MGSAPLCVPFERHRKRMPGYQQATTVTAYAADLEPRLANKNLTFEGLAWLGLSWLERRWGRWRRRRRRWWRRWQRAPVLSATRLRHACMHAPAEATHRAHAGRCVNLWCKLYSRPAKRVCADTRPAPPFHKRDILTKRDPVTLAKSLRRAHAARGSVSLEHMHAWLYLGDLHNATRAPRTTLCVDDERSRRRCRSRAGRRAAHTPTHNTQFRRPCLHAP